MTLRDAYVGKVVPLPVHGLRLELGVVDASQPGVAEGISRLLVRSIGDARASLGGHLPDWLVADVERNYVSAERVRTLWAPFGHRFAVMHEGEIVATAHLTRTHETVFTIDRHTNNVPASRFPRFKPPRHHHLVNLSVLHELRRARIGRAMIDAIGREFRELFDGDGIWVRGDPPWHVGLLGLGFVHDPSRDVFLPESAERTAGLSHAELNARYACDCAPDAPFDPDALERRAARLSREKLQYVSFTRPFEATSEVTPARTRTMSVSSELARALAERRHEREPVVLVPEGPHAVASLLAAASARRVPVVVRGRGQCLGDLAQVVSPERGLVLVTSALEEPIEHDGRRVTVSAGTTWRTLVHTLLAAGVVPRVVPGWLDASVGGTLATGGLGKGSVTDGLLVDCVEALEIVTGDGRLVKADRRHAAWLFEAALGGLGQVGVVTRATLALRRAPKEVALFVAEPTELEPALREVSRSEGTWHVTAFAHGSEGFQLVQVVDAAVARAPAIEGARRAAVLPVHAYLERARPAPPPRTRHVQVVLLPPALGPWLALARASLGHRGSIQIVPFRATGRDRSGSLLAPPRAHDGALVLAVLASHASDDDDGLEHKLLDAALALGGGELAATVLSVETQGWDARLGERRAAFERARALADPAGILGSLPGLTR